MNLGFIGAGKVCHALSFYFKTRHNITGIYSKTFSNADKLAQMLGAKAYSDKIQLIKDSQLIFIATSDDQIQLVAEEIALSDMDLRKKSFAHLSGSLSSEVLDDLHQKGATTFSMHPAQSFSEPSLAIQNLPQTVFTIEGRKHFEQVTQELFAQFANRRISIATEHKCRYHIAAVMLSNYLVSLYGLSEEILQGIGMSSEQAADLLLPLLDSTVANLHHQGFDALTGPIRRGDENIVQKHQKELENNPSLLSLYNSLANETKRLLEKNRSQTMISSK
ncbi:MAG: DUF2520 domain-containing protein [Peptostreptococcaceae bacterium]|nr:DUF2520 domain-containing protein [Peptostreptococcaceae bacterium]